MEEIINYLLSPEIIPDPYKSILTILEGLFLFISLVFAGLIVYVLLKTKRLTYRYFEDANEFLKFKSYGTDKLAKEWKAIKKRLEGGLESEYKLALINADIMLDEVLMRMGHTEETVEEKLKSVTTAEIQNLQELKEARKVRNGVVYDPDYNLTLEKAKETLMVYEESFKYLNAIS